MARSSWAHASMVRISDEQSIFGVLVGRAEYESEGYCGLDLGDKTHAERASRVNDENAGYFLLAAYD